MEGDHMNAQNLIPHRATIAFALLALSALGPGVDFDRYLESFTTLERDVYHMTPDEYREFVMSVPIDPRSAADTRALARALLVADGDNRDRAGRAWALIGEVCGPFSGPVCVP